MLPVNIAVLPYLFVYFIKYFWCLFHYLTADVEYAAALEWSLALLLRGTGTRERSFELAPRHR
jgi:hypothetical protein